MTITLTGIPTPENTSDFLDAERQLIAAIPSITVHNPVHNNSVIYYEHNVREWDTVRADSLRIRETISQICESDMIVVITDSWISDTMGELLKIPVYTSVDECINAMSSGGGAPVLESIPEPDTKFLWCEGCSITDGKPAEHDKDNLICVGKPIPGCNLYKSYEDAAQGDLERAIKQGDTI